MQWLFILVPYKPHVHWGILSATSHEILLELWGSGAIQSPWEDLSISTSSKIKECQNVKIAVLMIMFTLTIDQMTTHILNKDVDWT